MPRRPVRLLVAAGLAAASCAGCGGGSGSPDTILDGKPPQRVGFAEVSRAVADLYRDHPDIESYVVRDVEYTPRTRDKVLRICKEGGAEKTQATVESSQVFACAPLIFYFYNYGVRSSVPESVDLARKLYWYAVTHINGPYAARKPLTGFLRRWGVE